MRTISLVKFHLYKKNHLYKRIDVGPKCERKVVQRCGFPFQNVFKSASEEEKQRIVQQKGTQDKNQSATAQYPHHV